jgi:F0F1-type ATP synthase assembly protein I
VKVAPPVKLVPSQEKIAEASRSDQTLGKGMDFALVVLVFLGIGWGIDSWLDTRPAFMIGLVVFAVVGQFIKMYYDYKLAMETHEAERAEKARAKSASKAASNAATNAATNAAKANDA